MVGMHIGARNVGKRDGALREATRANPSLINSIHNSYHKESWEAMTAIKARILQIWDTAPTPVRICCIKFVQRVILVQTASNGMEQKVRSLSISRCEPIH